jgi:GTP-binding protein YchF
MPLTAGIVGLPNVGKSTLFNAITKAGALAANYPFATIDPNVGVVEVPDKRLDELTNIVKPQKTVPTAFEFTDIAGLVKGASKGEGLGNQFLSHIRETDAIVQVVRCFEDKDVTHVDGSVDPIRDIETINLELIFADLEVIDKRLPKIEKKAQLKTDKEIVREFEILSKIKDQLESSLPARTTDLYEEDKLFIKHYNFLTMKPILYVANVNEEDLMSEEDNDYLSRLKEYANKEEALVIKVCAKIEAELSELENDEKEMFLEDLGIDESGLDKLVHATYDLLGLATYFTAGEKEVRAWTFKKGMKAPQCAGVIHTDFEKGFIRAEVVGYDDLINAGNEQAARAAGKYRLEGKEYIMKDGDICLFRFNV